MVRDAEENAEKDAQRKLLQEAKNNADSLLYSTKKALEEHKDKIPEDVKKDIDEKLAATATAMEGDDAEAISAAVTELQTAAQKIGEAAYGQQQAGDDAAKKDDDDDVKDADFKEPPKDGDDKKDEKK